MTCVKGWVFDTPLDDMILEQKDLLPEGLPQPAHNSLNPSLCDKCRFVFEQSIPSGVETNIQHHENGTSMLQAAKRCHVCFVITYRMGRIWEGCQKPLMWTIRTYHEDQESSDSAASPFTTPPSYGITIDYSPGDRVGGSGLHFAMRRQKGQTR